MKVFLTAECLPRTLLCVVSALPQRIAPAYRYLVNEVKAIVIVHAKVSFKLLSAMEVAL